MDVRKPPEALAPSNAEGLNGWLERTYQLVASSADRVPDLADRYRAECSLILRLQNIVGDTPELQTLVITRAHERLIEDALREVLDDDDPLKAESRYGGKVALAIATYLNSLAALQPSRKNEIKDITQTTAESVATVVA